MTYQETFPEVVRACCFDSRYDFTDWFTLADLCVNYTSLKFVIIDRKQSTALSDINFMTPR